MGNLQDTGDAMLKLAAQFGAAAEALLTWLEAWVRGQLQQLGMSHSLQTMLLLGVAALLILWSLRLLDGLIRVLIVLILVAIALHIAMPAAQS